MPSVPSIDFLTIPVSQIRVPGSFFELSPTQANTGVFVERSLIIGQMLSAGTATANVPVIVTGFANAQTLFGVGSMLANMVQTYQVDDPFGQLWCLPVADNSEGAAAVQTITVTGPATATGTLSLYVAGVLVSVGVTSGDSATVIGTHINTAINANVNLPCTSTAASGVVTVTANHKGAVAGDIDLRTNFLSTAGGQSTPAGVSLAYAVSTAGATDPDLATPLSNLGTQTFDFICNPYAESAQLGEVETTLSFSTGRWSWSQELFGLSFSAVRNTFSGLTTFGVENNSPFVSIMGFNNSPTPVYIWAADYTAVCAASIRVDAALPINTVVMQAVLAPPTQSQWTISEANTLLFDGISTYYVDQANVVHVQRAITTYQTNAAGAVDNSYLNVERMATLTYVIRTIRNDLLTKFSRCKLLADGSRIPGGSSATTAQLIALEVCNVYTQLANAAEVQNPQQFAQNIIWSNMGNGTVGLILPIQVADQLEIIVSQVQFSA